MGTRSADGARRLLYDGLAPAWEAQQFQAFASLRQRSDQYPDFLLGRLLEDDLHVSCRPMLPPEVAELNGITIQGACILQVSRRLLHELYVCDTDDSVDVGRSWTS